ncbi:MAG: GtrA family protein [Thermoleophilia bacterium]|nr:GtrA family protein [Thermoleophilia bacterium]
MISAPADPPAHRPGRLRRELVVFALIGVASNVVYALAFLLVRGHLGGQASNVIALIVSTYANTAANRRFTFNVRGPGGAMRHQTWGFALFGVQLAITASALFVLHLVAPGAGHAVELATIIGAAALATVLRFVAFRVWVFRERPR